MPALLLQRLWMPILMVLQLIVLAKWIYQRAERGPVHPEMFTGSFSVTWSLRHNYPKESRMNGWVSQLLVS